MKPVGESEKGRGKRGKEGRIKEHKERLHLQPGIYQKSEKTTHNKRKNS